MSRMFSIGEFSRISGITVKALRFYHEQGLIVPTSVDPSSGYRYYDSSLIERARIVVYLRSLEFPIEQIRQILSATGDDQGLLNAMVEHRNEITKRMRELRAVTRSLDEFIEQQKEVKAMSQANYQVEERNVDAVLIAGVRMKGRYSDCSKGFARIGRSFGRFICGPAMMLHYDTEYKEDDADFEAAMPVKQSKQVDGIDVRQLGAVRCVCLVHKGPYDQLGPSYARVIKYTKDKSYTIVSPTREVYLKGPGMIFKGNPKNYLTEIQIPIATAS